MESYKKIDSLGRIVIPSDFRERLNISENEKVLLSCDGDKIIISTLKHNCKLCEKTENLSKKFPLCKECIKQIFAEAII